MVVLTVSSYLDRVVPFLRGRTDTYSLFTAGYMNGVP